MNLESIGEYDMQSQILVLDKNQTGNKQVIKRYPLQHDRGDTLIGMCFIVFLLERKVFSPHQFNIPISRLKNNE